LSPLAILNTLIARQSQNDAVARVSPFCSNQPNYTVRLSKLSASGEKADMREMVVILPPPVETQTTGQADVRRDGADSECVIV